MLIAAFDLLTLCGAVLILLFGLMRMASGERRKLLTIAGWFALSVVAAILGGVAHVSGKYGAHSFLVGLSVLVTGICLIRLVGIGIFHVALPRVNLTFTRLFQEVLVAVACIVWIIAWLRGTHQIELGSLVAPSAVVTAVLGLALQDTLGNIFGGVALQFEESVRIGDWIKVDDLVGRVTETHWRYTAVETRNWETVVLPNSTLLKTKFLVLGRRQGKPVQLRRWVWFNVDFRYDPSKVVETVLTAIHSAEIPNMTMDPKPTCVLMDLTESYGKYAVRYWLTDLFVDDPTDSEVRGHIYFALKRAGIPLSMPAHALFITKESESRKARKQEEAQADREEVVKSVELFHSLKPEEITGVATRLKHAPFFRGDVITRQGAEAHYLYILVSGTADVVVNRPDGSTAKLTEMGPGSFFGEMGLLTGAPRTATVIARSAVECWRLDKEAFQEIIAERPALIEELSAIMQQRISDQRARIAQFDEAAAKNVEVPHDLLGRIRAFFEV